MIKVKKKTRKVKHDDIAVSSPAEALAVPKTDDALAPDGVAPRKKVKKKERLANAEKVDSSLEAFAATSSKRVPTPAMDETAPIGVTKVKKKGKKLTTSLPETSLPVVASDNEQTEVEEAIVPVNLKIVVGGIAFEATEDAVKSFFQTCGEVESVDLPKHLANGKPKGIAFVVFANRAGVEAAIKRDGAQFEGRSLFIRIYERPPREEADNDEANTAFIKGLPYRIDEDALWKSFGECGEIKKLNMPRTDDGRSRSLAFISFATPDGLDAALKLDNTDYEGRTIWVTKAMAQGKGSKGKGSKGSKGKGSKGEGKGKVKKGGRGYG